MSKTPNPQGKGLVPVMEQLSASRPLVAVPPKRIDQVTRELFTSLFVLESQFKFKPRVGECYWLYRQGERWSLSMVSPREWGSTSPLGQHVGLAELHQDMTWSLTLSDEAAGDTELLRLIEERRAALEAELSNAAELPDVLPVFEQRLGFYPRLFASALAWSLHQSMRGSGIAAMSYRQACRALEDGTGG